LEDQIVSKDTLSYFDKKHFTQILKGGVPTGQLTNVGERQLFELGQLIRQRYMKDLKFLTPDYDSHQF
jgi:hypothetical protein